MKTNRKKDPNAYKRTIERLKKNRFSTRRHNPWSEKTIREYLSFDVKIKGLYKHSDITVAEKFERSIAAIQYMRRKRNMLIKLGYNPKRSAFIDALGKSEKIIRAELYTK